MKNHVHRDANGGMVIDVPGGGTVHEGSEDMILIYPETNLGAIGLG